MGSLTTHVLDTAQGRPGAGIEISVYSVDGERTLVKRVTTNSDGRTDEPILDKNEYTAGVWELVFLTGPYFGEQGIEQTDPPFLDSVVVRFGLAEGDQHYHVPLLVSPWSYSTYRGS